MTQLVANPFAFPRKLISTLFVAGLLAFCLTSLRVLNFDFDFRHQFANQQGRNASVLSFETHNYLDELIRSHSLSPRVEWAAWHIQSTQTQDEWSSVTHVPCRFQPRHPRLFDQRSHRPSPAQTFQTIELPSPRGVRPGQFNASRYLFGVSTSYERLMDNDRAMLKNWQWWLTDGNTDSNGAHMVVMLDRADDEQIQQLERALETLTIPAMVYNAGEPLSTATRYAQLAGELHAYGSALSAVGLSKKWLVLLDEAIFFPSLSYLDEKLSVYDANDSVYIGVPSEREDWAARDGKLSTSGGGVVIFSRDGLGRYLSLSCDEVQSPNESAFHARRWTSIIHECMTTRGLLPMHVIPGLYSPTTDSLSPSSNQLEAGARPIALRNHGRGSVDLASAYLVADECGEACFMQRFLFRDNWVLVNGVSISQYQHPPKIQHAGRLGDESNAARREMKAQLLLSDGGDEASSGGRLHLAGGGARNVWKLVDSSVDEYGIVWQAYVKRWEKELANADDDEEKLDSVIILIWNEGR